MTALRSMFTDVPTPREFFVTRWRKDPYSMGSYSSIRRNATSNVYDVMARPPPQKRLFFAGEATHAKHPQSVHGAYLSGIREGKVVNRLLKKA
eukprot:gene28348-31473_t